MEQINYQQKNNIGIYNNSEDYFYDLFPFIPENGDLSKIILYLNENKNLIIAIELFYSNFSTGIFSDPNIKINNNNNNKILIELNNNKIIEIKSSFIENQITKLIFITNDNKEIGFNNENNFDIKKLNQIIMKKNENCELISIKCAFNNKLTFFEPIFNEIEILNENKNFNNYFESKLFGKKFNDSIEFFLNKKIFEKKGKIEKIIFYHDNNILIGIEQFFILENNEKIIEKFGKINKNNLCDEIKFNYNNNNENNENDENNNENNKNNIKKLIINSGDMIDGISIENNINLMLISGGCGGGKHIFNFNKNVNKNYLGNFDLIGFEGSYAGTIHQIKAIFYKIN